jgi:hypothetical protein
MGNNGTPTTHVTSLKTVGLSVAPSELNYESRSNIELKRNTRGPGPLMDDVSSSDAGGGLARARGAAVTSDTRQR